MIPIEEAYNVTIFAVDIEKHRVIGGLDFKNAATTSRV
jgi:hypothetical protein